MFVLKHLAHMIDTICNMKCYASQSFISETKPLFSFIFSFIQLYSALYFALSRLDYLIMSTLLLRKASSEAPFNMPF